MRAAWITADECTASPMANNDGVRARRSLGASAVLESRRQLDTLTQQQQDLAMRNEEPLALEDAIRMIVSAAKDLDPQARTSLARQLLATSNAVLNGKHAYYTPVYRLPLAWLCFLLI